jgi:hypothetical protein
MLKIEKAEQAFQEFWQGWYASYVERRQQLEGRVALPTVSARQIIALFGVTFGVDQILSQTIRLGWILRELLEHERPRTYY